MNKDQYTITELELEVDEGHTLYVQDWGNKDAKIPIISLHGGPGGQSKDSHKGSYDPAMQRVIFFDQRGCGKSQPYGSLENNTTDNLVDDISRIADELGLDTFILTGLSWGSCLALAYAIKHPNRVAGMVLGGIFTGLQAEIDWISNGAFRAFYPDAWHNYLQSTPKSHQNNPSEYHFEKALNGTTSEQKHSAFIYETLEGNIVGLDDRPRTQDYEEYDPSGARIEMHYMKNGCFMSDGHIMENAHKLTMPVILIQGRYDMACPPKTAFELQKTLPNAELITTLSGHISEHEDVQLFRQALRNLSN